MSNPNRRSPARDKLMTHLSNNGRKAFDAFEEILNQMSPEDKAELQRAFAQGNGDEGEINPANPGVGPSGLNGGNAGPDGERTSIDGGITMPGVKSAKDAPLWDFLRQRLNSQDFNDAQGVWRQELAGKAGNDSPNDLPGGGMPVPGGSMTVLKEARDRLRAHDRKLAQDRRRGTPFAHNPALAAAVGRLTVEPSLTGSYADQARTQGLPTTTAAADAKSPSTFAQTLTRRVRVL